MHSKPAFWIFSWTAWRLCVACQATPLVLSCFWFVGELDLTGFCYFLIGWWMKPTFGCLYSHKLVSFATFDDCCIKHKMRMRVMTVPRWVACRGRFLFFPTLLGSCYLEWFILLMPIKEKKRNPVVTYVHVWGRYLRIGGGHVIVGFSVNKLQCFDFMNVVILLLPQYYNILKKKKIIGL